MESELYCCVGVGHQKYSFQLQFAVAGYTLKNPGMGQFTAQPEDFVESRFISSPMYVVEICENSNHPKKYVMVVKHESKKLGLYVDKFFGLMTKEKAKSVASSELDLIKLFENRENSRSDIIETKRQTEIQASFLIFETSEGPFSIETEKAVSALSFKQINPIKLVQESGLGYVIDRGLVVPVIQLGKDTNQQYSSILTVKEQNRVFGIPVRRIEKIINAKSDQWDDKYVYEGQRNLPRFLINQFFSDADLDAFVNGYKNIFNDRVEEKMEISKGQEEAFLEVNVGQDLHVPLNRVIEVIKFSHSRSEDIIANKDVFFNLKHRDQEIKVWDIRQIYKLDSREQFSGLEKIVIIDSQQGSFGILVDAITKICRIDKATKIDYPRILLNSFSTEFQSDISQFFTCKDILHQNQLIIKAADFKRVA